MSTNLKNRKETPKADRWNVEAIYADDKLWTSDLGQLKADAQKVQKYKGRSCETASNLKELLDLLTALKRRMEKLMTYARLRHDEDIKNEHYKTISETAGTVMVELSQSFSWIEPEILKSAEAVRGFLDDPALAGYRFDLEKTLRYQAHTLSEPEEKLLAGLGQIFDTTYDAFTALSDAELRFGKVGRVELTHAEYGRLLHEKNRAAREQAFRKVHRRYDEFPATFATLLQGRIRADIFSSRSRKFKSCLESALFANNIPVEVYKNLITTVRSRIPVLRTYLAYRKNTMGLKEIKPWDLYVPFVPHPTRTIPYTEAAAHITDSVSVLGKEYQDILRNGLGPERWVDRYENRNKRSGAYSGGCHDTLPYILLNYNGTFDAVKTLSHEAGHSMHSYHSRRHQTPVYSGYPIFLAEVASTFCELLFVRSALERSKANPAGPGAKAERRYIINSVLEDIRGTFFRQTMFAEFELKIHELAEQGIPLTYQLLKKEYLSLNEFYLGRNTVKDTEIAIEWARIPHFYYNFYVYQYATGIAAAIALFRAVEQEGAPAATRYLNLISAGSSAWPLDLLRNAGVDMASPAPIGKAIDYFSEMFLELKRLG